MLNVRRLSVRYGEGDAVVRDVDFDLGPGATLGLLGASGAGKSALLTTVFGLAPPDARIGGSVYFAGRPWLALTPRERARLHGDRLAMLPQHPMQALHPHRRIGAQLSEVLQQHRGLSREAAHRQVLARLRPLYLPDTERLLCAYPHQLCDEIRYRLLLAMALLCRPRLLLIDEPGAGLDASARARLLALLREVCVREDLALLLASRDPRILATLCGTAAVLAQGGVVEQGPMCELLRRAQHPVTRRLLRATPGLKADWLRRTCWQGGLRRVSPDRPAGCAGDAPAGAVSGDCRRAGAAHRVLALATD